jgi:hypothetical protein
MRASEPLANTGTAPSCRSVNALGSVRAWIGAALIWNNVSDGGTEHVTLFPLNRSPFSDKQLTRPV